MHMTVYETIANLRQQWTSPRRTSHSDRTVPDFELACSFDTTGTRDLPPDLPSDLSDFWTKCSWARLFEDRRYGQWGLVLWQPSESSEQTVLFSRQRKKDFRAGDRVVGRFLGDSELLLVRCDPNLPDFGNVIVALPLYGRADWDTVAVSFSTFLEKFAEAEGGKYWE